MAKTVVSKSEPEILASVPKERWPRHIAIIMDGNGRWAQARGLPRARGHQKGSQIVRRIVKEASMLGLEQLTLYAFSSENWKRPKKEVDFLMRLYRQYLIRQKKLIMDNNIRFRNIGRTAEIPRAVREQIERTESFSAGNTGMVLALSVNYGGRQEILDAVKKVAADLASGLITEDQLSEERFSEYLYTAGMPDPDLLIRTAGEMRVSNFLLWQISYTEFLAMPVLWPDFREQDLWHAIADYADRKRRFGGLSAPEGKSQ